MDMNDFPASLYHWNNVVGDWWGVSASEVHRIYRIFFSKLQLKAERKCKLASVKGGKCKFTRKSRGAK
jgi:hypothetical protein